MIFILGYLVFGFIFALITSGMAKRRSRSGGLWGLLGFFFGIIPMILLLIIGSSSSTNVGASGRQYLAVPAASKFDEIAKLKGLLDSGVLTKEEFEEQKRRLLS